MTMKNKWRNASPSIRRAIESVTKALASSLLLIAVAYLGLWHYFPGEAPGLTVERAALFIDAIFAGIVAFALVGAFTFVASVRPPEEAKIDDRVASLFSARREESAAANRYLREQVVLLGATVSKANATYTVLDVSVDGRYVRVSCAVQMSVMNMMKHDAYHQEMPLTITVEALPDLPWDLGTLHGVKTTACHADGSYDASDLVVGVTRLTNGQPVFEQIIDLRIPASGRLIYEYSYDCWTKADDQYSFGANRFVEVLDVTVINRSSSALRVHPWKGHTGRHVTFPSTAVVEIGASSSVEFKALAPEHRAAFRMEVR